MTRPVVTILVVIHLVASLWHGDAHAKLAIDMPLAKDVFIWVVIVFGPLVGLGLVWTRHERLGLWIVVGTMLGALGFGAYHHYVLVSPDHVGHLPPGPPAVRGQFRASAVTIALLELLTAVVAGALALRSRRAPIPAP